MMTGENTFIDEIMQRKQSKAERYAEQPELFTLTLHSDHGTRRMIYYEGAWRCDCPFFHEKGICSHLLAGQILVERFPFVSSEEKVNEESSDVREGDD